MTKMSDDDKNNDKGKGCFSGTIQKFILLAFKVNNGCKLLVICFFIVLVFFSILLIIDSRNPKLVIPRYYHSSILLNDGIVLVTGGFVDENQNVMTNSAEIYNPISNEFLLIKPMNTKRAKHSSILLPDGKVLIIGGDKTGKSCEIFNPENNSFSAFKDSNFIHIYGNIAKLYNGNFLLLGGNIEKESNDYLHNEIFNVKTNSFEKTTNLSFPLNSHVNIIPLSEEYNLFARGYDLNQNDFLINYNDKFKKFYFQNIKINKTYPWFSNVISINKDKILIFLAFNSRLCPIIYDIKTKSVVNIHENIFPRYNIVFIKRENLVYLIGGNMPFGKTKGIDIFDIEKYKFTTIKTKYKSKYCHSAILLKNKKILLIGGYNPYLKNKINKTCKII